MMSTGMLTGMLRRKAWQKGLRVPRFMVQAQSSDVLTFLTGQ